ncbi:MAG TPA: metallophosphoesterase family protein [Actinomycetota bacterium]|nr:metallophosphoesterase family protein [Actinomycetota bacterium]
MDVSVAAIYDIHGNIDALDAVLKAVESQGIERIVIGGDVAWGPFPAEVVARIRSLDAHFVRGNADREVACGIAEADEVEGWVADVTEWCAGRLSTDDREFLAGMSETVVLPVIGMGDVLFCHATPRSDDEIVTAVSAEEDVAAVLAGVAQDAIICGHTHSQYDRAVGTRRVINAGSVGLPYEDRPGAYWAVIGDDVTLRRTEYDYAQAAARIGRSGCPDAAEFAGAITSPMSRSSAIELFEARRAAR